MNAAREIEREYEVRKYLDGKTRITKQCPTAASPFSLASLPLLESLNTIVELATIRFGAFGAVIALVADEAQHVVASCQQDPVSQKPVCDRAEWLNNSETDGQIWTWLAKQLFSAHIDMGHQKRSYTIDRLDLTQKTSAMSSVNAEPYLRHYTAVPITTSRKIDIGYLAIVGQATFGGLDEADLDYLTRLSERCMTVFEATRVDHIQSRWSNMSENLSQFLFNPVVHAEMQEDPPLLLRDIKNRGRGVKARPHILDEQDRDQGSISLELGEVETADQLEREHDLFSDGEKSDRVASAPTKDDGYPIDEGDGHNVSATKTERGETTYRKTFNRAAMFIRDALDVDGALFVDGIVGFHGTIMPDAELETELEAEIGDKPLDNPVDTDERDVASGEEHSKHSHETRRDSDPSIARRKFTSAAYKKNVLISSPGEILGLSYLAGKSPHLTQLSGTTKAIREIDERYLQDFLQRHDGGKVWYFDKSGQCFYLRQDQLVQETEDDDINRLKSAFPGARQLIFCSLVNPVSLKRLAGFFAWTTREAPVFTDLVDLKHIKNFCYMVEAEVSRIDNISATKQQESFVASVSHELRTPLHGILGAAQFLSDSTVDLFQRSLIETIESCGTTLHETLTSVMSYAKINQFERIQEKPRREEPKESLWHLTGTGHEPEGQHDFHEYDKDVNVVSLCEEVISVVEASHSYKPITTRDVAVMMRVEYRENWNFITEPGALRRVALNIIGNALKYTSRGTVELSLRTTDLKDERPPRTRTGPKEPRRLLTLTCTDTGKGMTQAFVENQLFVPFSQEEPASSSGVGLGMSIVKSLVSVLGGEIRVSSVVDQGTKVEVRLPMTVASPQATNRDPLELKFENDVDMLRQRQIGVVIDRFSEEEDAVMKYCLQEWFKCRVHSANDPHFEPDIVIVNEGNEEITKEFFSSTPMFGRRGALLSVSPARLTRPVIITEKDTVWERTPRPVGPKKFAAALAICLAKLDECRKKEAPVGERKTEEIDQEGHTHELGSELLDREAKLPNDQREQMPPTSMEPLSREMAIEIDQPPAAAPSLNVALFSKLKIHRKDPRVLIVEDNSVNLRLLKIFIQKCGYRDIVTAVNGALAVEASQKSEIGFDIIFMDLSMPVMDGFEATRRIRETEEQHQASTSESTRAHIVALTGLASKQYEQLAFNAGVDL